MEPLRGSDKIPCWHSYDWWNRSAVLAIIRIFHPMIDGTALRFFRVKSRIKQLKIMQG
jgi:hypothetical protein